MKRLVHTVGLGSRDLEDILGLLRRARVTRVADVRRYSTADRYPWHAKDELHRALVDAGFEVCDFGEALGGDRNGGFRRYMETKPFQRGFARLRDLIETAPTALLCAERAPDRCHRRWIGEALETEGWIVRHHVDTLRERASRGDLRLVRRTG